MILDDHFIERLNQRFDNIDLEDVEYYVRTSEKFVPADVNRKYIPYKTLISKLYNPMYSNSVYYVNKNLNAIFVMVNNSLKNVLYLDGRYGY